MHLAHGHHGQQGHAVEALVHEQAARLLIPMETLLDALRWTADVAELADECWVDERTMTTRLDSLTSLERAMLEELAQTTERHA